MVLTTSGLKKRVKRRLPVGTIGKGKSSLPGKGGTAGKVARPVVGGATIRPVTPKVRPVVGAGNKGAITVKRKALVAKGANKKESRQELANQKKNVTKRKALIK